MSHHVGSFPLGLPLRPEREPAPVHVEVVLRNLCKRSVESTLAQAERLTN